MSLLEKYRCTEIVNQISLPENVVAYRMDNGDGMPDMRGDCDNLQGCSCCDYFMIWGDSIILIEDGYLGSKVGDLREECAGIDKEREDKYIITALRRENAVKVYGSLLMLCRLSMKCPHVKKMIYGKEHRFWIVNKGSHPKGKSGDFDGRGQTLSKSLNPFFGKEIEVNILTVSQLEKVLNVGCPPA